MPAEAAQKFVPGAPPPPPLTKTQKKKRRTAKKDAEDEPATPTAVSTALPDAHAAALTEKAPTEVDVKSGAVAPELVAQPELPKERTEEAVAKQSPVVELLNKRLKTLGKKITRIHMYSGKPESELNEDQKKTLATLPSLEAVRRELEETKKAIEVLEAEQAQEAAQQRTGAEEVERKRVAETVAAVQKEYAQRTAQILDFIRLHSLLSNGDPSIQALNLVEAEVNAIYASVNTLLAHETESRQGVVTGFLLGEGDIEGVSFTRLLEIVDAHLNSPVFEQVPTETEEVSQAEFAAAVAEVVAAVEQEQEPEPLISGILPSASGISGVAGATNFRFMQESELDSEPVMSENGAEWVEKEDTAQAPAEVAPSEAVNKNYALADVVETKNYDASGNGSLNWADDEGGLPSIDGLHASFGTSGSATPAAEPVLVESQSERASTQAESTESAASGAPNGQEQTPADEDGFMQARGGRGRGRARGFRGSERGAFRGDRGNFRGGRGGRGRPHQGSESGNWRGGPDGEHRGRGRGRGRGFERDRGARGGRGGNGNDE